MEKKRTLSKKSKKWLKLLLVLFLLTAAVSVGLLFAANEYTLTVELEGDEEIFLEYGEHFVDPGVKTGLYGSIIGKNGLHANIPVTVYGSVSEDKLGKYQLRYEAESHGVTASAERTVWVVDTERPEITLVTTGNTQEPGTRYQEEGFRAIDNYDGDITASVVRREEPGFVIYSVVDSSGNPAVAKREVPEYDDVPPVIELNGGAEYHITAGVPYVEPGFTAIDNYAGDLTQKVQTEGEVCWYLPGTYPITYTVTDKYDNTTVETRNVTVDACPRQNISIPDGKTIYLTFDDGPGPYTDRLLDILKKYDVKATFFVVGTGHQELMQRIVDEGHSIAIHSITHDYKTIYASEEAYFADILGMQEAIENNTGVRTTLMRFPGGSSNMVSRFNKGIMSRLTEAVQDAGFQYFDWNVDSNDAGGAHSADEVFENVTEGVSNHRTSVVLQHDIHSFSVDAVERIILWGKENGYTFRPLTPSSYAAHHGVNN